MIEEKQLTADLKNRDGAYFYSWQRAKIASECLPIGSKGQIMRAGPTSKNYEDYHRPLATYSEKERNRILESKAQRRARAQLHKKLRGAVPGVFNVMQDTAC